MNKIHGLIFLFTWLHGMSGLKGQDRDDTERIFPDTIISRLTETPHDTVTVGEVIVLSDHIKKSSAIIPAARITSALMAQFSPAGLADAVNQTPGVYIQSGAINTNRITIRGVGARTLYGTNKIRAYFNGIPITNGIGETAIDIYDQESLDNIEIIKGPRATEFGTNLGGTILLNPIQPLPGKPDVKNNTTFGSYGLFKNATSVNYRGNGLSVHLHYDHLQTDGFRENSDYNRNGWLLHADYAADKNSIISILFQRVDYFAQIASSIGKTAFDEDRSQAAPNWKSAKGYEDEEQTLIALSYSRRYEESFRNTTSFFYSGVDHYEPRPFNILDEKTSGYGVRSVFSKGLRLRSGKTADLHAGGEWYADQYDWKTIENLYRENNDNGSLEGGLLSKNREFRDYLNIFVSARFPLTTKLGVQAGLNLNTTTYDYNELLASGPGEEGGSRSFDPVLAPNFNLSYKFTSDHLGYFNISRGFNYPGLEETLTPDGTLNPDIGPEKGWNYEFGGDLSFFQKQLHLNVTVYLMRINGLLVAQRTGEDEYAGRNAGKTKHRGIEIAGDCELRVSPDFTVSPYLHASFDFHRFVDFRDGENDFSGNDLTGVPDKRISAGIRFHYRNGFWLYSGYEHTGRMPMNDANTWYSEAWNLLNLKMGYRKEFSGHFSAEANVGVNNITDEKYASSILINATSADGAEPRYFYPGMPRNYYGGVKLRYIF